MAAATETVGFDIRVTGDQQAAAKFDRVSGAFKKLEVGGGSATKTLNSAGERIAKISSLAAVASPELGKLSGSISKAASAASVFSLAIGGVAGIAVGGIVAAFGAWTDATKRQREELDELNKKMIESNKAAITFEQYLSAAVRARSKLELEKRLGSGAASSDEYQAQIMLLNDRLKKERERFAAAGSVGSSSRVTDVKQSIAEYQARLDNARAREAIGDEVRAAETYGQIGDAPGAGKKEAGGLSAAGVQLEQLKAAGDARKEEYQRLMSALSDVDKQYEMRTAESNRMLLDERKRALEDELQAARSAADERIELRRREADEAAQLEQAAAERRKLFTDMAISGLQGYASVSAGAMQKVAKGQKIANAAFLESIGDQAFADGTFRVLQGVAMLAALNPAGAAVIAAGTAEAAFGLALGSAGALGAGGSTSEARRANAARNARGGGAASSEPTTVRRPGDDGPRETRSNIVVQVNTLVADERTGETIMGAIESANSKLGRRLSPGVVGR